MLCLLRAAVLVWCGAAGYHGVSGNAPKVIAACNQADNAACAPEEPQINQPGSPALLPAACFTGGELSDQQSALRIQQGEAEHRNLAKEKGVTDNKRTVCCIGCLQYVDVTCWIDALDWAGQNGGCHLTITVCLLLFERVVCARC